jgi:hypothetical protein
MRSRTHNYELNETEQKCVKHFCSILKELFHFPSKKIFISGIGYFYPHFNSLALRILRQEDNPTMYNIEETKHLREQYHILQNNKQANKYTWKRENLKNI